MRSPLWPNPHADRGQHHFTYSIYPHQKGWQSAKTVRHAYELNIPLQVVEIEQDKSDRILESQILKPVGSLLDLSAENLVLMALKIAPVTSRKEEVSLILRCYECHGEKANLQLKGNLGLQLVSEVNGLEEEISSEINLTNSTIQPWQVKSFHLDRT